MWSMGGGSGQSVKVRVEEAWTVWVLRSLGHAPLFIGSAIDHVPYLLNGYTSMWLADNSGLPRSRSHILPHSCQHWPFGVQGQ
jgi:hypothetical protein